MFYVSRVEKYNKREGRCSLKRGRRLANRTLFLPALRYFIVPRSFLRLLKAKLISSIQVLLENNLDGRKP